MSTPNPKNSLASPTPVVDTARGQVYVHFGASGTAKGVFGGQALTTSGDVVWTAIGARSDRIGHILAQFPVLQPRRGQ